MKRILIDREKIVLKSMRLAYVDQATFTPAALASSLSMSASRQFRAYLKKLVRLGLLEQYRVLFNDGHYRLVYCGNQTRKLPFTWEQEPEERRA